MSLEKGFSEVRDGLVWCAAGRSSYLDGGIRLCALDLESGEPKVLKTLDARDVQSWPASPQGGRRFAGNRIPGTLPDVLSASGDLLYMRWTAFDPQGNLVDVPKPHLFSARVVNLALTEVDFGRGEQKNERCLVEFSNLNTHKAFHVGHLRSTILGDAITRILTFAGYDAIPVNYYGDMGLHVIKWLWNYINFHEGEKPPEDATRWSTSGRR